MDKSKNLPTLPQDKLEPPPPFEAATASGSSQTVPFRTRFACITLNKSDRIRFINFFDEDIDIFATTIQSAWPKGVQDSKRYAQSYEFQLYGRPWSYDSSGDDRARRLVRRVLEALFNRGWVLQGAVDLSKKEYDKGKCCALG